MATHTFIPHGSLECETTNTPGCTREFINNNSLAARGMIIAGLAVEGFAGEVNNIGSDPSKPFRHCLTCPVTGCNRTYVMK